MSSPESGRTRTLEAQLAWADGRWQRDFQVEIDGDGRIARCGALGVEADERLHGCALLPGFVNAHSHAFQRGLRGRGEHFPAGAGSFWSWREAMYGLVEELDETTLGQWCRRAFGEMRAAGITAVGEFHYLRHLDPGARDHAFDEVVVEAARATGLRLTLLVAYYRSGGIGTELSGGQQRFATPDPESYWRRMDELEGLTDGSTVRLGAVAHSIRAADPGEIRELHTESKNRGLVFHMHLEEQPREIEECREAWGVGPLALVTDRLEPGPEFCAVHATHSTSADVRRFAAAGAHICLCPLTEANLGDGLPAFESLEHPEAALCLGTDSNARISMLEEMRLLEYGQRLRRGERGVVLDRDRDNAPRLLEIATRGGAGALGLEAGRIEPDAWADFAVVDLAHPTLAGTAEGNLLPAIVFGAADGAVSGSLVGGLAATRTRL